VITVSMAELAETVKQALDSGDIEKYATLLAPDATWGAPDDNEWGCHDRREVLGWYRRAREAGMRAEVSEVVVGTDKLLVGLRVSGRAEADEQSGPVDRWQVLTIRDGLVADIRGFEDRDEAARRAGVTN
jgi:ketosteroid isomerase-like protein